jgi:hypothetical protein
MNNILRVDFFISMYLTSGTTPSRQGLRHSINFRFARLG